MKKRNILLTICAVSIMIMTSCIPSSRLVALGDNTRLQEGNFDYVRTVKSSASSFYVLGLVGGGDHIRAALDDLRENASLKKNQALVNQSVVTESKTYLGLVTIMKTFVTADIVEFKESGQ
ncbi:MAG: hypothetical protein IKY43_05515 [Bacteroidales bacterium]|jgi:hypothetical protein|nr:hypothetical protein [Bacteroidales bacterium]